MQTLAWPGAVVIIAIAFMYLFRKQIGGFIDRIKTISKNGVMTVNPQLQTISEKQSSTDILLEAFSSKVILSQEDAIKKLMEVQGIEGENKIIAFLLRLLAITRIGYLFEHINSVIWGSQIAILQHLNAKPDGESPMALMSFYNTAAQNWPDVFVNYSFSQYIGSLLSGRNYLR